MLPFAYCRPDRLGEVTRLLDEYGGTARLLAGGTDLTVGLRHAATKANVLIDIKRVEELRAGIELRNGLLSITATVTMSQLVQNALVQRHVPALVEAATVVGSRQIRNRATLVGNVCNASPAADTVPVIVLYGATVAIFGLQGEREVPVLDFILGNRQTALARGEIVTAVNIPLPEAQFAAAFDRITRRRGVDLATVNLTCSVDSAGRVRMAIGAAAPRPLLVHDTEGVFSDPSADPHDRAGALDRLLSVATPISDVRASAEYRMAMLKVLAQRTLSRARNRLQTWVYDE